MNTQVTRRSLICSTVAGIACAGLGGSLARADEAAETPTAQSSLPWLPAEPADPTDIEEELACNVLVIGAGTAGVCAARSAAEEGASVVVVEKCDHPAVCRSGQWAVIGGKTMEKWGRGAGYMDPQKVVDEQMGEMLYYPKRSIMSRWAKENGEVFDWFISAKEDLYICENSADPIPDVECALWPRHYPLPEGYDPDAERFSEWETSVSFNPGQEPVLKANWEAAQTAGALCYTGHFAEKLIVEDGRVRGAFVRNAQTGSYKKIIADGGVILATGEYASNPDMVSYYTPELIENEVPVMWTDRDVEGNPTNTGDGLKLGAWIGAAIQQQHAPMVHYMGSFSTIGNSPYLRLNLLGKRFMDEDVPAMQVQCATEGQPGRKFWTIWDSKWVEQLQAFQPRFGSANYVVDEPTPANLGISDVNPYVMRDACDVAAEAGSIIKADTLEGLINQMSDLRDSNAALASIERYNELAHAGEDTDFGKPANRMFPIEEGPFYAFEAGMNALLAICGGLVSDEECHVYDADRNTIAGLYACGNIQGSRFAVNYPCSLSGLSHSMCMFYGYIAGKNAIKGA